MELPFHFGKISSPARLRTTCHLHKKVPLKGLGIKILCAPLIFAAHRVSGATIYTGRMLLCAINTNVRYSKRTSRPATKLLTASYSPLSADEIFSITVLINARCSSETKACPNRVFSSSDRTPDGAGLVPWPSSKAGHGERWGAAPSALCGSGEIPRDDTSASPALLGDTEGGGIPLSIISGRRSPEDEFC